MRAWTFFGSCRSRDACPAPRRSVTTSISVLHSPWAGTFTVNVSPSASNSARSLAVIAVARANGPRS